MINIRIALYEKDAVLYQPIWILILFLVLYERTTLAGNWMDHLIKYLWFYKIGEDEVGLGVDVSSLIEGTYFIY